MAIDDYSGAEQRVFTELGFTDLLQRMAPFDLYRLACEVMFLNGQYGPPVGALRRAANAFMIEGQPHRMTAEFDALLDD